METVTVTSKGQLALPVNIRRDLEVETGTKMLLVVKKGVILMKPLKKLSELKGILKGVQKSAEELIKEVRLDWEKKLERLA